MSLKSNAQGQLTFDGLPLTEIAATFGTPCYVYSAQSILQAYQAFDQALGQHAHLVCFAVKANSNLSVLKLLAQAGAGFDIVSQGELERVLLAGGQPAKVVFSGVAKGNGEILRALEVGIKCFNVESAAELARISALAHKIGKVAPISFRVNPDVDAKTHPYISTGLKENKFGVPIEEAFALYQQAAADPHLQVVGMDCHIGSQLTDIAPYVEAAKRLGDLAKRLATVGIHLHHMDLGGGIGVQYREELPPSFDEWVQAVIPALDLPPVEILVEPGRSLVANAGVLLTQVEYTKANGDKNFAIIDAAMNDLIRPSLYGAWMGLEKLDTQHSGEVRQWDFVGPVCETGDFLAKDRSMAIEAGDLLAVRSAGAYGFVMASNYNTRPLVAEVLIENGQARLIRQRQSYADIFALETPYL